MAVKDPDSPSYGAHVLSDLEAAYGRSPKKEEKPGKKIQTLSHPQRPSSAVGKVSY